MDINDEEAPYYIDLYRHFLRTRSTHTAVQQTICDIKMNHTLSITKEEEMRIHFTEKVNMYCKFVHEYIDKPTHHSTSHTEV